MQSHGDLDALEREILTCMQKRRIESVKLNALKPWLLSLDGADGDTIRAAIADGNALEKCISEICENLGSSKLMFFGGEEVYSTVG